RATAGSNSTKAGRQAPRHILASLPRLIGGSLVAAALRRGERRRRGTGGNGMSDQGMMNGAEWLARALAGTGMSHVFFVESTLRRTLLQLGDLGVTHILAHAEKAAAYMADGYARVAKRPGICMAQSVGAANLAAGLQDAWLGRSPVIAFTGHKEPSFQHRNSYQEIPHAPLFSAV